MSRRGPCCGRCLSCGRAVWLCAGITQPRFLHHAPLHPRCYHRLMSAHRRLPQPRAVTNVEGRLR